MLKNRKLTKNKKLVRFLAAGLLLSAVGLSEFSQSETVHADNLVRYDGDWVFFTPNNYRGGVLNSGKRLKDVWGYWTINGNVVWCMEPAIAMPNNEQGIATYDNGTDIIRNNSTIQVRSFNHTRSVSGDSIKAVAGIQWMVYNASDKELNDLQSYFNSKNDAGGVDTVRMAKVMRGWGRYKKWTSIQLMVWHLVSDTIVTNVAPEKGALDPGIAEAAYDINGYEDRGENYWVGRNRYLPGSQMGSNGGQPTGNRGVYTMRRSYEQMKDALTRAINDNVLRYDNGFKTFASRTGDQRQFGGGADFSVVVDGYLKATKEFSNLKADLNTKPNWNPNGIRVGVYRDANARDMVGTLTINANGESNKLKVKPGRYYGFELTPNGVPIKSSAMDVVSGNTADRGYVSGSDKKDRNRPYVVWDVTPDNNENNPDVETFVNTPEVVNFTFAKEIADLAVRRLAEMNLEDPATSQYTRVGAVYTLYKDARATQVVTRNGQPVTATIGQDGTAEFSDLYRGVYYVKETTPPSVTVNGMTFRPFELDATIYTVDLNSMSDNKTTTGDSTVTLTSEFKKQGAFQSDEEIDEPNRGSLVIEKRDKDTDSNVPQGQGTLQDAHFKVEFFEKTTLGTANPAKMFEVIYKTDANGEIDVRTRDLMVSSTNPQAINAMFDAFEGPEGEWGAYDYRVTEVSAPNGYKLEARPVDFVVQGTYADFRWKYPRQPFLNDDLELEMYKRQRTSGDWQTDNNVSVPNASFKLTNKTTGWTQTVKTDANGKLIYHGVAAGQYTLQEVAVEDYQTNGQVIELTVEQRDGTTKLTAKSTSTVTDRNGNYEVSVQADGDINVVFDNTPHESNAKLIKANEKGARLGGAKFRLTDWGENEGGRQGRVTELVTNENGELDWSELVVGHWYSIEEIEAPQGYKLPADRLTLNFRVESVPVNGKFEVSYWTSTVNKRSESNTDRELSANKKLTVPNQMQDGIKFVTVDSDGNGKADRVDLEFDFVNNTWKKLPATGSFVGPVAGVAALVILVGSTVFYFRKREGN